MATILSKFIFSLSYRVPLRDTALIAQKRFLPNADIYTSPNPCLHYLSMNCKERALSAGTVGLSHLVLFGLGFGYCNKLGL